MTLIGILFMVCTFIAIVSWSTNFLVIQKQQKIKAKGMIQEANTFAAKTLDELINADKPKIKPLSPLVALERECAKPLKQLIAEAEEKAERDWLFDNSVWVAPKEEAETADTLKRENCCEECRLFIQGVPHVHYAGKDLTAS